MRKSVQGKGSLVIIVDQIRKIGIFFGFMVLVGVFPSWAQNAAFQNPKVKGKTREMIDLLSQNLQVSGGVDGRLIWKDADSFRPELEGLFLNLRKIFRDELGDRWILSLQGDADDNFDEIRFYQSYFQYKGPLGKWNIRTGHYILPFGLVSEYDTERLILKTIENDSIGIKLDSGIEAFGYRGDWDWALSASDGIGRRWFDEINSNYLFTGRVGRKWEATKVGLSVLVGRIKTSEGFPLGEENLRQQKVALDVTHEMGQWIFRAEVNGGMERHRGAGSGVLLADYALTERLEMNTKYALVGRSGVNHQFGLGLALKLWKGLILRIGDQVKFGTSETHNQFETQLYYDFSKHL